MDKHPLEGWTMVVCNPISGSGKGRALLSIMRRSLDDAGISYACEVTRRRGHAAQLARSAVCAGCSAVVAIGGDGTFFEVVNGVLNPAEFDGGVPMRAVWPLGWFRQAGAATLAGPSACRRTSMRRARGSWTGAPGR